MGFDHFHNSRLVSQCDGLCILEISGCIGIFKALSTELSENGAYFGVCVCEGDGSGSFILKDYNSGSGISRKRKTARYSIALQYLVLEEINEEGE